MPAEYSLEKAFSSVRKGEARLRTLTCAYFAVAVLHYKSSMNLQIPLEAMLSLAQVSETTKAVVRSTLAPVWEEVVQLAGGCSQKEFQSFFMDISKLVEREGLSATWAVVVASLLNLDLGDCLGYSAREEGHFLSALFTLTQTPFSTYTLPLDDEMFAWLEMRQYALHPLRTVNRLDKEHFLDACRTPMFSKFFFMRLLGERELPGEDVFQLFNIDCRQPSVWLDLAYHLRTVREGGTCVALLFERSLTSTIDATYRSFILEHYTIERIVTLPMAKRPFGRAAYSPFDRLPVAVLHIRNQRPTPNAQKILMTHARKVDLELFFNAFKYENDPFEVSALKAVTVEVDERKVRQSPSVIFAPKYYQRLSLSTCDEVVLKDLATLSRGVMLSVDLKESLTDTMPDEPWVRYATQSDITTEGVITPSQYVPCSKINKRDQASLVSSGAVILTRIARPLKVAVLQLPPGEQLLLGPNLYAIHCDEHLLNPYYLCVYLVSPLGEEALERILDLGVMPSVPIRELRDLQIVCLPIEEQRAIATRYQHYVKEIQTLQQQLDEKRATLKTFIAEI